MSRLWDVLGAARDVALGLDEFEGVTAGIRSRPYCDPGKGDRLPFLCVSPGPERVREYQSSERVLIEYPVYMIVFLKKGVSPADEAAHRATLDRREALRDALWRPRVVHELQSLADYNPRPEPPWDMAAFDEAFELSIQLFTFSLSEPIQG